MSKSDLELKIHTLLKNNDLDLRKSKYRFMDQKVTPDVLNFISDCIENLSESKYHSFTKNDIWNSSYFSENIKVIYNKPDADNETMKHEYDKFCAQPLKTLAYAGVLKEQKISKQNHYEVNDHELLSLLALNVKNCWLFLKIYVTEVLKASDFYQHIEKYIDRVRLDQQDASAFNNLKKSYIEFSISNSSINGEVEVRRIFPKVLNPIAVDLGIPGSAKGKMSSGPYKFSDLMYNDINFRDRKKNKGQSRQEAGLIENYLSNKEYLLYQERKIMQKIRTRHYPKSEVKDQFDYGQATQVHHIFPKSRYSDFRAFAENLILLTAQQHYTKAHPNNNTNLVDIDYQFTCLLSKLDSIEHSEESGDAFYSKINFVYMINTCLKLNIDADLEIKEIRKELVRQREFLA